MHPATILPAIIAVWIPSPVKGSTCPAASPTRNICLPNDLGTPPTLMAATILFYKYEKDDPKLEETYGCLVISSFSNGAIDRLVALPPGNIYVPR